MALRAVTALAMRTRISADPTAQNRMAAELLQIIDDLAFETEMGSIWGDEKLETALIISPSLHETYKRLQSLGLDTKLRTGLVALSAASLNQPVAVVTRSALQLVLEQARPAGLAITGSPQQQQQQPPQQQPQPHLQPQQQPPQPQQQPPQPQQQPGAQKTAISLRIYCRSNESHQRLKKREAAVARGLREKGLAHQIGLVLASHAKELFDRRLVVQEKVAQTSTAGREQTPSFREPFVYYYLPESVTIRLSPRSAVQRLHDDIELLKRNKDALVDIDDDARKLASEYTITDVKFIKGDDDGSGRLQKESDDEKRLLKRFHRYVLWLASPTRRTFQFVSRRTIATGLSKITEQLIGVEDLTRRMKKFFHLFSSLDYNIPHGVLLYGPPGTGKTTIVELLCEYLDVQLVAAPLASGDFNKPLMGESERMVEHVGERARVIPWQFCALAIDEIDGLAPTRDANASGGKVDLLSKILSMVGGNQNVSNLVLFGSTNRFDMMDEAFRRRIEFKFFVGKPSFEARRKWIVWKMLQHAIPLGSRAIIPLAQHLANGGASFRRPSEALRFMQDVPRECEQAIENLVSLTINFSNDAMRMLMRMLHEARGEEEGPIDDAEALEFVRRICQAERIFLGSRFAPDILESVRKKLPSFDIPMMRKLAQMLDKAGQDTVAILHGGEDALAAAERMRCTHRLLVDFSGAARHQFNMQMTMDRHMSPEQHQIFARLHNPEVDTQWMIRRKDIEALNIIQSTAMRLTASEQRIFQDSHFEDAIVTIEGLVRQLESRVQLHNLDIANHDFVVDTLVPVLADNKDASGRGISDFVNVIVDSCMDRGGLGGNLLDLLSTERELVFSFYNKLRTTALASGSDELIAELRQVYTRETDSARDFVRKASAVLCERAENLFKTRHDVEHYGVARPDALSNEEVLYVLIHMAIRCRLECVYLIDGPALSKHHCVEDTAALNFITGCLEEAQQYESGMFIIDLDSVANVTKSYSSLTEDSVLLHHSTARLRTTKNDDPAAAARKHHDEAEGSQHAFSYNVQRPNVLCSVLDQVVALPAPNKLFWMVVLTKDPYLASRFKEKFTRDQWPLNADELRVESEAKEAQRERVCSRCAKVYTERDNHPDSCRQHQRSLLCRLKVGPPPTTPGAQQAEELVELKSKEEYLTRIASSREEVMRLIDARWMCCGRGPFDDGESMCSHSEADPADQL